MTKTKPFDFRIRFENDVVIEKECRDMDELDEEIEIVRRKFR